MAQKLSGAAVSSVTLAGAGRNGRVFKVASDQGPFAMKSYPSVDGDGRDRLGTEYAAFAFLHAAGERATPRPVARMDAKRIALYEWIDGGTIDCPCGQDIEEVIKFVRRLHRIAQTAPAADIAKATESCLSARELLRQVDHRLNRLNQVASDYFQLQAFLLEAIKPALEKCSTQLIESYAQSGFDVDAEIPPRARTLSPSDFGFHNALRRPDGSLVFVDFEYFGWDDPVRLVSDFIVHPGMALSSHHQNIFRDEMGDIYSDDDEYPMRLSILYPLVVLRWCMILLNEFLPEKSAPRPAGENADAIEIAQSKQLEKARTMLGRLDEPLVNLDHAK